MAIVNRMKRLFRADVHAILDSIEEPEAVLKQAIREMEEALDQKRARLTRQENALDRLKAGQTRLQAEMERAREDVELCMQEGSEELARKTIGRKLVFEKHLTALQQRISQLQELCTGLRREIDLQQGQLESVVEKARLFAPAGADDSALSVAESILSAKERSADPLAQAVPGLGGMRVSDEEIELEWIRLRDRYQKGDSS